MSHARTFTRIFVSCLFASLGSVASVQAIENGQVDHRHHNVGVLGLDLDGPGTAFPAVGRCTGFIVSDRAFVTAAHCFDGLLQIVPSWVVTLEGGTPEDPVAEPGIFTGLNPFDFPIKVDTVEAIEIHIHPGYDPGSRLNDIAVLEFVQGTFEVRPVRLAEPGYLDDAEARGVFQLMPLGLVGYGATEDVVGAWPIPGHRRSGFAHASGLTADRLSVESLFPFDAALGRADSGSPQFLAGRAVSLNSGTLDGVVGCCQRLDTPDILLFLVDFID